MVWLLSIGQSSIPFRAKKRKFNHNHPGGELARNRAPELPQGSLSGVSATLANPAKTAALHPGNRLRTPVSRCAVNRVGMYTLAIAANRSDQGAGLWRQKPILQKVQAAIRTRRKLFPQQMRIKAECQIRQKHQGDRANIVVHLSIITDA